MGSTGFGRDVMAAAQPPQKKAKSSQAESCELAMPKGTLDQLTEALRHALQRNMAGEVPGVDRSSAEALRIDMDPHTQQYP